MDVINIETHKIRRSVHTPDFPFPWVDLRQVDLSGVEGTSPALWVIEPSGKGDYKARTKTAEELADPVAEAEDELRKLQEKAVEDIRQGRDDEEEGEEEREFHPSAPMIT